MSISRVEAMEREIRGFGVIEEVIKGCDHERMREWMREEGV
jgi:hypothetical protein